MGDTPAVTSAPAPEIAPSARPAPAPAPAETAEPTTPAEGSTPAPETPAAPPPAAATSPRLAAELAKIASERASLRKESERIAAATADIEWAKKLRDDVKGGPMKALAALGYDLDQLAAEQGKTDDPMESLKSELGSVKQTLAQQQEAARVQAMQAQWEQGRQISATQLTASKDKFPVAAAIGAGDDVLSVMSAAWRDHQVEVSFEDAAREVEAARNSEIDRLVAAGIVTRVTTKTPAAASGAQGAPATTNQPGKGEAHAPSITSTVIEGKGSPSGRQPFDPKRHEREVYGSFT